ncbi:hypothetical protein SKTS_21170 [Sulfurimicrobium lacus]|uniref:Uncharacterized protein n=1 Tax=Sulfurimicrobium lacus TaxID=2715678 RepID=A0A6F8VDK0_9PROT|nr:hypothetical protein SKTS_21170 [Sulfurimicrobium lacus]
MRHRAGVITGAMSGNTAGAAGIDGTETPPRRLPRCLPISDSIQGIAIPTKWNSSNRCSSGITVTSRVTP